ncbi:MAG: NAD-glutamate dehydrogenase [Spirochaetia bacterium]|nr:NAD-glutamate dehydrogenase [Spirochaetia bacterium]
MNGNLKTIHQRLTQKLGAQKKKNSYSFELLDKFIEYYLLYLPEQYLQFLSDDDLIAFLLDRFDFFYKLPEKTTKEKNHPEDPFIKPVIRLNYQCKEVWLTDAMSLEIISTDMPFIVDSLSYLFHEQGLRIKTIIHPVFKTHRKNGNLDNLQPVTDSNNEQNGGSKEAYSMFIFDRNDNVDAKVFLRMITEILSDIRYVVSDFSKMTKLENIGSYEEKFLFHWLLEDNFLFLGAKTESAKYGLFRSPFSAKKIEIPELKNKKNGILFFRLNYKSKIRHNKRLVVIFFSNNFIVIGIFTRKADNTSSAKIPLLSDKIKEFQKTLLIGTLFDRNDFIHSLNLFPLEYRFIDSPAVLLPFCELINIARIKTRKMLKIQKIENNRCYLALMWPESEFSDEIRQKTRSFLEKNNFTVLNREIGAINVMVFVLYEILFEKKDIKKSNIDDFLFELEEKLEFELLAWDEQAEKLIERQFTADDIYYYKTKILPNITGDYKIRESGKEVIRDISSIRKIEKKDLHITIYYNKSREETELKFFYNSPQTLSAIVPVLDNLGLEALREESYCFKLEEKNIYIYKFYLRYEGRPIAEKNTLKRLIYSIEKAVEKRISSESINALVMKAEMSIQQVQLLKAFAGYLAQLRKEKTALAVKRTLLTNIEMAKSLVDLFESIFLSAYMKTVSDTFDEENHAALSNIVVGLPEKITAIEKFSQEKKKKSDQYVPDSLIIKETYDSLKEIIFAIKRTNYFNNEPHLSLKIKSSEISFLPFPKPYYEIWVYHSNFEGIHIRGGPVSRGGLRWSDRPGDFRTEISGLWKTQMLKNTVIIPTGAKGGFVIKYLKQSVENAIWVYKNFIGALLEITDNRLKNKTIHPPYIPRLDETDPYLVVAADKGTAAFSDFANEISQSKNFWLDDGFASGGKNGYSHKELGITARGAWESARWHFFRMGKDPAKDVFSAVGIGDMAGDVFGNGMLLSDKIQLKAAFNHKHIFLDPNPDPAKSFIERKRLFETPKTQWTDYNKSLISKGGGVFERDAVSVSLSNEAKEILMTEKNEMTGEELVRAIIKAPVDMLFNGGIGTYVKAEVEDNTDVGDKANDRARINGTELRAKMVVEGGNLGMTPLSRLEYALKGGLVNTDAIDNSGGVDMSDHEVNLKILLREFAQGKLFQTNQERNKLLKKLAAEEVKLVLSSNFSQNNAVIYNQKLPLEEQRFILLAVEKLEKENILRRTSENIPEQATLENYIKNTGYLPAPLLCILLAYVKFFAQNKEINIPDEFGKDFLINYFPKILQKHTDEIEKHPLKNDIIKTLVVNHVIDNAGIGFFEKSRLLLDIPVEGSIEIYLVAERFLGGREYRKKNFLPNKIERTFPQSISLESVLKIQNIVETAIFKFMEMTVLFADYNIGKFSADPANFPGFPYKKWQKISLPDWLTDFTGETADDLKTRWLHIEIRFLLFFILQKTDKKTTDDLFDFYFESEFFDLKKCLYNIYPSSEWEAYLLVSLKRDFWKGLVKAFGKKSAFKKKVDIKSEIETLKEKDSLSLSSIGGLLHYILG